MSKVIFTKNSSEVQAPDAGQVSMYVRTDGNVVLKDETGVEKVLRSGTDIQVPVPLAQGGTGVTSQQGAINTLTNSPAAATGNVLTRNAQGNAVWLAPTGGGLTAPVLISQGGTGETTAQEAISALTGAALANPGQVLTIENDGSVAWADAGIPSVVPINKGGTGETTADAAIAALTGSASATTGQVLTKAGDGTLEWTDVVTPTDVIAIAQGGTGQTTRQAALNALANAAGGVEGQVLLKVGSDVVWGSAGGGSGPTANLPDPTGQPANQVVVTSANASYILTDASSVLTAAGGLTANIVNAKGDLIVGTADNAVSRQAVGANGKVLAANSAQATGVEWVDRATLTGSTVNALPRVTGANAMSASGVTLSSSNVLTVPAGGQLVSDGPTYAKAGLTVSGNIVASGGAVSVTGNISSSGTVTAGAGVAVTGNITVTGNVDGRDVSADGAKLDALALSNPKSNTTTVAPTVNDDVDLGYTVGSVWNQYSTNGTLGVSGGVKQYVCTDNTNGAAVWKVVNSTSILPVANVTPSDTRPVVLAWESGDAEKGILYSRPIKGGSNIVVELSPDFPGSNDFIRISTASGVVTDSVLSPYGTNITPDNGSTNITIGTTPNTYGGILIGASTEAQLLLDPAKPPGLNPTMTLAGSNPYARQVRTKGARGMLVGEYPASVDVFSERNVSGTSLAAGTVGQVRLQRVYDFGAKCALPFPFGVLHYRMSLEGEIGDPSVLNGKTYVPSFRWYLAVSNSDLVAPTLALSGSNVVAADGDVLCWGYVNSAVALNNADGTPLNNGFRMYLDLHVDMTRLGTGVWNFDTHGMATTMNDDADQGTPGDSRSFVPSSGTQSWSQTNLWSNYGYGTNDRPRLALYLYQLGSAGIPKYGIDYFDLGTSGMSSITLSHNATFAPRLNGLSGDLKTTQYLDASGNLVTY